MLSKEEYEKLEGIVDEEIDQLSDAEATEYAMTVIVATTNAYIGTLVEMGVPVRYAEELAKVHCISFSDIINQAIKYTEEESI